MNERVIEAAAKWLKAWEFDGPWESTPESERAEKREDARALIEVIDAARAPDIRAAVEQMLTTFAAYLAAQQAGDYERTPDSDQHIVDTCRAWNRDLTALYRLLNIPDDAQ